ncbi:hypothetical protein ACNS7O_08280 [Haloferacaceae archaeon DSL9]
MPRLTITIPEELDDELQRLSADDAAYQSKADALRELVRRGQAADDTERRLAEKEAAIDRLRREVEQQNGQIAALETQLEASAESTSEFEELVSTLETHRRASLAPFFVRWLHWWRHRESATDEFATSSDLPDGADREATPDI